MTWMDRHQAAAFRLHLKADGRRVTYCRGEEKKGFTALANDVIVDETAGEGVPVQFQAKTLVFFTKVFPFGEPKDGDTVMLNKHVYDVVRGANGWFFDYEDMSEQTMTVMIQRRKKKEEKCRK